MSLVSIIGNYGAVVMVSDLAISAQYESFRPVVLPVRNLETAREDFSGQFPISLRQKMIIVKQCLLVGATGDEQEIRELFKSISDFFMHRDISEVNLSNFINEQIGGRSTVGISAFFALPADKPGHLVAIRSIGEVLTMEHPSFDSVRSIGSEAKDWN